MYTAPKSSRRRVAAAFTFALGLGLLAGPVLAQTASAPSAPAAAQGKLDTIGAFANGDTEVDVATYTAPNDQGVEERVGLLGVRVGTARNSAAFSPKEWRALLDLWVRAKAVRSRRWIPVGDFTETGTSDVSHLAIGAGPGVRFTVESPAKAALTVDLKRQDMPAFAAALARVKAYLGTP